MLDATPLLRLYGRARLARLARQDAAATQERQLMRLLRRASGTRFGRDHGFADIRSVAEYQRRVPLRRFEEFWEEYWKDAFPTLTDLSWPGTIPYFAVTSGTSTGRTKHIPVSRAMLASNNGAGIDLLVHHVANRPKSRVLGGKNFMLGGSVDLKQLAPGVHSGDLTGIIAREVPAWAPSFIFPPRELAQEADWERKMERVGRASLDVNIRTIAGTASWLLLFFDRLAQMTGRGRRLVDHYPDLELLVHGGVNFAPYRPQFEAWLGGSHAELREVYPASEGFIAVADRGPGEGMRMILDRGLFYELVPVEELDGPEPTRHWIADADVGRDYAIVLSTCAGLWAYRLGDLVRLVSREPPRLLVTGRTSYFLSAFGEHLTGEEIELAVADAAAAIGTAVTDFSVGALFPEGQETRGGHLFVVELTEAGLEEARLAEFARILDRRLAEENEDYEAHRAEGFGMKGPEVLQVAPGTFAGWMRARGKLGGQNKVPRVVNDPDLLADLRAFAERHAQGRAAAAT
jgi:hypothetical protein